jgi:type II secretion system protein I
VKGERSELRSQRSEDYDDYYALCGGPNTQGFTLLEVMIAMAVFFIVVFAVLGVVVQSMGAARALQRPQPDFSILASQVALSNVLEEGSESGDFGDLGDEYKDYVWDRQIVEVGSNGLFQVDFAVTKTTRRGKDVTETMSVLMYKPGGRRKL